MLVGEGSWRERGTRQGLKAPTYLGDERGPEGPLFHGCAQSVLLHGFQKALLHGFRESVLVGKGSSRKWGAGRGLKAHRDWAMNAALKGRSSTVVQKSVLPRPSERRSSMVVQTACSSTAFEKALFHGCRESVLFHVFQKRASTVSRLARLLAESGDPAKDSAG